MGPEDVSLLERCCCFGGCYICIDQRVLLERRPLNLTGRAEEKELPEIWSLVPYLHSQGQ